MVFQNLSRKIPLRLILIFIFLAIGITITGTLYYSNQKDHIKQEGLQGLLYKKLVI
jgi:hypothetical protein